MTYQFIDLRCCVSNNTQHYILPWICFSLKRTIITHDAHARERDSRLSPSKAYPEYVKCLLKTSAGDHYGTAGRLEFEDSRERALKARDLSSFYIGVVLYVSNARRVRKLRVTEVYPLLHLTHLWNSRLFTMYLDMWFFTRVINNALRKIILDFFFIYIYSRIFAWNYFRFFITCPKADSNHLIGT